MATRKHCARTHQQRHMEPVQAAPQGLVLEVVPKEGRLHRGQLGAVLFIGGLHASIGDIDEVGFRSHGVFRSFNTTAKCARGACTRLRHGSSTRVRARGCVWSDGVWLWWREEHRDPTFALAGAHVALWRDGLGHVWCARSHYSRCGGCCQLIIARVRRSQ